MAASVWLAEEVLNARVVREVAIKVFLLEAQDPESAEAQYDSYSKDIALLGELATIAPVIHYYHTMRLTCCVNDGRVEFEHNLAGALGEQPRATVPIVLLVMEYADGGAISGEVYRKANMMISNQRVVLQHFVDICQALQAAHSRGVIHRDIKPQNILWLQKANQVRLSDFGLAIDPRIQNIADAYFGGTLPYMSPECFEVGRVQAPERDVYALGCTLYEVICGHMAIDLTGCKTVADVADTHRRQQRPYAMIKEPELASPGLSRLLVRMMSPDPIKRPLLPEVIGFIEEERARLSSPSYSRPGRLPLPSTPQILGEYAIDSTLRRRHLKQTAFFLLIRLPIQQQDRLEELFHALSAMFGAGLSIWEVYGTYDFVVRVWTSRRRLEQCCKEIMTDILENEHDTLRVFVTDHSVYLGAREFDQDRIRKEAALVPRIKIHLEEAQAGDDIVRSEAVTWLRQKGVYVAKRAHKISGRDVRGLSIITLRRQGAMRSREELMSELLSVISTQLKGWRSMSIACHRRSPNGLGEYATEEGDYALEFVARDYASVIHIPALLTEQMPGHVRFVDTHLATMRYYVDSDYYLPEHTE